MKQDCKGFGLIEVLVALLLLSIATLGIAGVQIVASRHHYQNYLHSVAAEQAQFIIDRMRANTTGAVAGYYQYSGDGLSSLHCAPCDPRAQAARDLNEWDTLITDQLPQGQGSIQQRGEVFDVQLQWVMGDAESTTYALSVQL